MNKTSKSEELKKKTLNYADEIVEITDFVEQVRQTPDIMIGKVRGNSAFLTMVREILQNSIDEILKGNAYSPLIFLKYNESSHWITVEDNGRGIPHGKIGVIFGASHTSSNYVKQKYQYSAGKNGCGASTTNALSHRFVVDSYVLGKAKHAEFDEGHLWKRGEVNIDCGDRQGTTISFLPNEDIIGQITASLEDVANLISLIVPTTPIGTTVEFTGIDTKGQTHIQTFKNTDGIYSLINKLSPNPMISPIHVTNDNGDMKVDLLLTYDTQYPEEGIISLNNTCPTGGGTHVDGALDGIVKFFRNYMNKIYLSNSKAKTKVTCIANDIRTGLRLAISTFCLKALYNGQAKEILDDPKDMIPFVSNTVQEGLGEWSKSHPQDLLKLCKYFKDVIDIRLKADKEIVKLRNNFSSSILGGMPSKYIKPNGNVDTELVIVEGDSAFGAARNSRDAKHQGIFPIRGKLPNAFEKTTKSMLENAEIAAILSIIGAGYGRNFNIDKCKVSRVVIMADADPDGAHIRTLVLVFLLLYCRPLVEAGRVFASLPPLYGIKQRSGWKYFLTKLDFIKYVQKDFQKNNIIKTKNNSIMSNNDSLSLLYNNSDYVLELERLANSYAINPYLLEFILANLSLSNTKFSNEIKKRYRFLNVSKVNGILSIEGVCYEKYHKIFITDSLISESGIVMKYISNSSFEYYLNDEKVTLYGLMKQFEKYIPSGLSRFKGLGEMNADELGRSTLRPDGDRQLIRYTVEDIESQIQEMRYINSNKDTLLNDILN